MERTLLLSLLIAAGCGGWPGAGPGCRPLTEPAALPPELSESSGVAASRSHPGAYWTLDDGGPPVLYAVDARGTVLGSLRLDVPKRDWEDLALAPCEIGGGGEGAAAGATAGDAAADCLWIADTGDNQARRDHVVVYRVREPGPSDPGAPGGPGATGEAAAGSAAAAAVDAFRVRFPDGPRDVEALFVLPGAGVHLISKGRHAPPTVYRYPGPLRRDSVVTAEEVQRLDEGPRALPRQVTGAAASADGRLVAVRTYETLTFMAFRDGTLHAVEDGTASLRTLEEPQGEAVGLGPDGEVVLTSEAGPLGGRASIVVLRCRLPGSG